MRIRQQLVLFKQGEHQGIITQLAAVIRHPVSAVVTGSFESQIQRLLAARCIPHQFECHAQLHQRKPGSSLSVALPDFTQRTERRFLLTSQHQRSVRLNSKFAGLGVVAVADGHHPRIL